MTNARYLLAWFVMLLASIANGTLRDFTYGRHFSELPSQQISTLTGIVMLGVLIYFYVRRWPPNSGRQALNIGLFWVSLTIAFEFLFFHYVGGRPWNDLLANYDMSGGRLWPLLLAWIAVAPLLFYRLRLSGS